MGSKSKCVCTVLYLRKTENEVMCELSRACTHVKTFFVAGYDAAFKSHAVCTLTCTGTVHFVHKYFTGTAILTYCSYQQVSVASQQYNNS